MEKTTTPAVHLPGSVTGGGNTAVLPAAAGQQHREEDGQIQQSVRRAHGLYPWGEEFSVIRGRVIYHKIGISLQFKCAPWSKLLIKGDLKTM